MKDLEVVVGAIFLWQRILGIWAAMTELEYLILYMRMLLLRIGIVEIRHL